jgi:hypothetical protein
MKEMFIIELTQYGHHIAWYRGETGMCRDRREAKIYQSRSEGEDGTFVACRQTGYSAHIVPWIENRQHLVRGFNTGRLYQSDGQRISYVATEDGNGTVIILFNDHSRGISGKLNAPYEIGRLSPQFIMDEYDAGRYSYDPKADAVKAEDWGKALRI